MKRAYIYNQKGLPCLISYINGSYFFVNRKKNMTWSEVICKLQGKDYIMMTFSIYLAESCRKTQTDELKGYKYWGQACYIKSGNGNKVSK